VAAYNLSVAFATTSFEPRQLAEVTCAVPHPLVYKAESAGAELEVTVKVQCTTNRSLVLTWGS